jgi:hypothetical protein
MTSAPKPELADVVLAKIAAKISAERQIPPEQAVEWLLESTDRRTVRAIVRTAIRTWQELADGEDRAAELDQLSDLIKREVRRELNKGWRDKNWREE